jgi:hypothetical protein
MKIFIDKMKDIDELYLLPIYIQDNPHISDLTWHAFMHFYLKQYLQDNLHYRWNFLKTVNEDNIYEKVTEDRDRELNMIL